MPYPNIVTPEPFNANNLRKNFPKSALGYAWSKMAANARDQLVIAW